MPLRKCQEPSFRFHMGLFPTGISIISMSNSEYEDRAKKFSRFLGLELKGVIASHGFTQTEVASGLGRGQAALSKFLSARQPITADLAYEVCDYVGADLHEVVGRAEKRMGGRPDEG